MKRAVNPVLREIGDQEERRNLDDQRQRSDGRCSAQPTRAQSKRISAGLSVRIVRISISSELMKKYVRSTDPLAAEDGLLGPQREEPLERNEDR